MRQIEKESAHFSAGKPRLMKSIVAIVIVSIIIIATIAYIFVFKKVPSVTTITMQELMNDVDKENRTMRSYKAGDVVYVRDKVINVTVLQTSYGPFTTIIFNATWLASGLTEWGLFLQGNKSDCYHIDDIVTIPVHFCEWTVNVHWKPEQITQKKFVLLEEWPLFVYVIGLIEGGSLFRDKYVELCEEYTLGGEIKLKVNTTQDYLFQPLTNFSITLKNWYNTTVDIMDPINVGESQNGHIIFTDTNDTGILDTGDYITVSTPYSESKFTMDFYGLWLRSKSTSSQECCALSVLCMWHSGFFYIL